MSRHTDQIAGIIRQLTTEHVPTADGKKYPAITITLERLARLVAADETAVAAIDGYPSKTSMAGPPSPRGVRIDPETGEVIEPAVGGGDGTSRPAEASALALVGGAQASDPVSRIAAQARRSAEIIARELQILASTLDRADNLRSVVPITTEYCSVARVHGLPYDLAWEPAKRTTFKGYLKPAWPEERTVCRWVYTFVRDHRRIPSEAEMRQHLERDVVMLHTA